MADVQWRKDGQNSSTSVTLPGLLIMLLSSHMSSRSWWEKDTHSHSTQLMPTSGVDLSEDVAVGIVRMEQGGKCREWHNWCISVISKDSQCGCSQSFHPPLCEKEMVLNNKLHFYLQKTQTETNSLLLHPTYCNWSVPCNQEKLYS